MPLKEWIRADSQPGAIDFDWLCPPLDKSKYVDNYLGARKKTGPPPFPVLDRRSPHRQGALGPEDVSSAEKLRTLRNQEPFPSSKTFGGLGSSSLLTRPLGPNIPGPDGFEEKPWGSDCIPRQRAGAGSLIVCLLACLFVCVLFLLVGLFFCLFVCLLICLFVCLFV